MGVSAYWIAPMRTRSRNVSRLAIVDRSCTLMRNMCKSVALSTERMREDRVQSMHEKRQRRKDAEQNEFTSTWFVGQ